MELQGIPTLTGASLLGHTKEIEQDSLGMLRRINREGHAILQLRVFNRPIAFVNTPELIHEVLVEKARCFDKSAGLRMSLYPLAGEGLFTSRGALWKRQRRLMAPLFQHSQIAPYARAMGECAARVISGWRDGQTVDVAREMTRITMGVVGKTLFDTETMDEADELGEALTVALEWANQETTSFFLVLRAILLDGLQKLPDGLPPAVERAEEAMSQLLHDPPRLPTEHNRKLKKALATLDRKIQQMIDERRESGLVKDDLLTTLLKARDEDDGQRMSDRQVRDEALTLFVAGHETTANALSWSFYLLAQHPEAAARLEAEADALPAAPTSADDLLRLGHALQVFKESMRLYPPLHLIGRQAIEDVEIGGHLIPKGVIILMSPYSIHRRPELYPDPERFDPGRFTREAEEKRHRLAYLPFGGGPRVCIGNHFAMMEGQLVLGTIARRFRLERRDDLPIEPRPSPTLRPEGGMPMRVRAR
jgi:cytochrome P450